MSSRIVTYTGRVIDPLDPDPDLINIRDIAHSLSQQCRFTGHTREFYSVASHSTLATLLVPEELKLTALLHDASEAYLSDLARPVKHGLGFGEAYREVESRLQECVADKFDLPWPFPEEIHDADDTLLRSEQRDLMPDALRVPGDSYTPFPIYGEPPQRAEFRFLEEYRRLSGDNR
jgi:hypothetical protein